MPPRAIVEFEYRDYDLRGRAPARSGEHARRRPIDRRAAALNVMPAKRALDIGISLVGLVLMAPLFVAVAILIKSETPGPVLFRQRRYGRGRRTFEIFKFRTMTVLETEGSFRQASANDDRVTRIGRFLRRSSLDEMPQLLNVLAGDMSLVGPRPHAIAMDDAYATAMPRYNDRFLVRPGLTGLAQINGFRGPTDTHEKIARRVTHDRAYIRRWSPLLDLAILARTPVALVRDPNAL